MSYRFALAFGRGAHRHSLRERAVAASLKVGDLPNILLVAEEETPCCISDKMMIVGEHFARTGRAGESHTHQSIEQEGIAPKLAQLIRTRWGNFAAFVEEECGSRIVYRDPSGAVPIYQYENEGEGIFVSDATLARKLGLMDNPAVDTSFVAHWFQYPFLRTAQSGIEGFRELLPGLCRMKRNGSWIDRPIWHPAQFTSRAEAIVDSHEAAAQLRRIVLETVGRQVKAPAMLQLSGGLDSSILAACLHHAGIAFTGINFATCSADGDERRYARAVASSLGIDLVEVEEEEARLLEPPSILSFRPGTNPLLAPFERAVDRHAEEAGATMIVDGGGGDNLFCHVNSAGPVLDALRWAGPSQAIRTIDDIAARAGCTSWEVARSAARRSFRGRRQMIWKEDRSLLRSEALLTSADLHPWLGRANDHLPGKAEHVEALVHVQHFLDRRLIQRRGRLHPLMAAPLLELCLRIPSWLWLSKGRDRAIAREAFKDMLPPIIVQRRTKGSLQGLFHRSFVRLSHDIRDLLLDGELMRLGILDGGAIEQCFRSRSGDELVQLRLTEMTAMELWLRSWRR